jgi:hypothetical protein
VRLVNTYGIGEYYAPYPYPGALCIFMYHTLYGIPYTVYTPYHRTFTYVADMGPTLSNQRKEAPFRDISPPFLQVHRAGSSCSGDWSVQRR